MDIEINEVQEIIKNLESSGELSIKEEKYLKVAKLCVQLAVERDAATLEYDYLNDQIEYWKNKSINITEQRNELAAENVALKAVFSQEEIPSEAVDAFMETAVMDHDWNETSEWSWVENETEVIHAVLDALKPETPATDRIVAGFKADGVAEREKTITFTAAKKRTQDGVALIAIGKPYKIHNDDVIGEFFIGERGRYGVITMDRLDYFTTSDEYEWEFSLREGADK